MILIAIVAVCTVCMAQIKLSRVGVAGFCRNKANFSLAELDKIKFWANVDKVKKMSWGSTKAFTK